MKTIFFDINVILDIFLKREPFYASSAQMFSLAETKQFKGWLGALSYPILFYLLKKELDRDKAIAILKKVRIVLKTAPLLEKVVDSALSSDIRDFEDAMQYYSALEVKSDYFITRNKKDYPTNLLQILTPDEFLALLKSESAESNSP
ncbi:PIN domain-containing protein [candidate division KSB1 bacterium]|nr:PIN domain-containing protein [candidate division KSB1 bacterium]